MFSSILSADLPYAELAFFGVLAIGLILGIARGFSKSFNGFFLSVAIILCSILLITPTFMKVRSIGVFNNIESSLSQSIEDTADVFSTPITIAENGAGERSYWIAVQSEGVTTYVPLEESMGSDMASSAKGKLANWLAQQFITESGQTIGSVAGIFITDIIVMVLMFIVYCIILDLICKLIRKFFSKLHDSESRVLHIIDRTCGAIISTGFSFVFILVVLAIAFVLRNRLPQIDSMISSSTICNYFYCNNPIATLFTEIFG